MASLVLDDDSAGAPPSEAAGPNPSVSRRGARLVLDEGSPPSAPAAPMPQSNPAPMPAWRRFAQGMLDPIDAGAQYLPYALGAAAGGFGTMPNPVSDWLFSEHQRVSNDIRAREQAYQQQRGQDAGADVARMAGNVLSPATLALGAATGGTALPATTTGRAAMGAAMGGAAAGLQPVTTGAPEDFGKNKGLQAVGGAVVGAVATPVAAKAFELIGRGADKALNVLRSRMGAGLPVDEQQINITIRTQLSREGLSLDDIPETVLQRVRQDVAQALQQGRQLDAAAALRARDFEAIGTRGTLGQITRDPAQFTREQNLRGVENAGESIMRRMNDQRRAFGDVFTNLGASRAQEPVPAAEGLAGSLRTYDAPIKARVDALYNAARDTAGRYAPMDHVAFAKAANDALDEGQLGYVLPDRARTLLNDVSTGKLPLNVNTFVQMKSLLGNMSALARREGDKNAAKAVDSVIRALDGTAIEPGAGPAAKAAFDTANRAAAARFRDLDAAPALRAAVEGTIDPDRFVQQFVIGGKTPEVKAMAGMLDGQGREIARQQIAAHLERKAFGRTPVADGAFNAEQFNGALQNLGRGRLSAFFGPEEIDLLHALGRAAGYATKPPAGSAVNNSNTAAAAFNLLQRMKGASVALPVVKQFGDIGFVNRALQAEVPSDPLAILAPLLAPTQPGLLGAVPLGAGVLSGTSSR